ncbi:MCE-family protein MCE3A [Mycobacterium paraense]|uniref:MCE-family protein MCE3A n=1 Tax=Mycobacterium paraense TaxID=767916 RepID=A0A1X2A6K9_9MYCO|nr:MCE family protein [Mycobacterium paraense]ORW41769.1 MCE-family protein MCE3A [Mycobacterium paraense]
MQANAKRLHVHPAVWTAVLIAVVVAFIWLCSAMFAGTLNTYIPVTLMSDRAGLVMESGAKVKMRGVQVGRVAGIEAGNPVRLKLELFPEQINHIPANVEAQIRATTLFGAKYVDLVYPESPSRQRISAGIVLRSRNVTTEVNTVFENLVKVLHQIDPPKLNAVLTALAEGVRGRGERMGEAITASNHVLGEVNPRMPTLQHDWQSLGEVGRAYGGAAQNLIEIVRSFSTTGATITAQASDLDDLLLNVIGVSQAGIDLLAPNRDHLVRVVNVIQPTTDLLLKYNPEYTCLLVGAKSWLDNGGYNVAGAQNGRSILLDDAFLLGSDPYRYPDNLPIVAAKGGPGGKPGCGSLPDVATNYPVRQLVTNTGWGTGLDIRPNPGIGFPGWANFFPVTRGTPEPPSIRYFGPPAPGPVPIPGAPPYGAPQYAPDGTPLYPPPPGPPPAPTP